MPTQLAPLVMQAAFREGSLPQDMVSDTELAAMGLYVIETAQRFVYGQRLLTVDGRVFKYCNSLGTLLSGFGAANIAPYNIAAVLPAACAVGDTKVLVTIASTDGYAANGAVAENELVGAYFIAGNGESLVQNRMIIANTAVAATGGTITVTLDGGIANVMTKSSSYCEIILNPYRYLSKGAYQYQAFMCVPALNAGSGYKFWGQTWGPCWVTPGGGDTTPGSSINDRSAFFVGDGSVNFGTYILGSALRGHQYAGFAIEQTSASLTACPLLMLQISI